MNTKQDLTDPIGLETQLGETELLITPDDEDLQVVRQSFRVPIPEGLVSVSFNGRSFPVKDLSMYGIGMYVEAADTFEIGEELRGLSIIFPDQAFLVDATIIHISPGDETGLICGVNITRPHDAGYIDWMTRVIREIKASVLTTMQKKL